MKKIILASIVILGVFTSCNSSKSNDYDSFSSYINLYNTAAWQNNLALDPFNVAYRLHVYLEEGETNAVKEKLFPGATTIETEDNQTYKITYARSVQVPEKDMMREGRLLIHTHGSSLTADNAAWEIMTDPDSAYLVNAGSAYWGMQMGEGEYVISNTGTSWNVRGDELYIYVPSYYTAFVTWDVNMDIKQISGSGSSLDNARFEVTTPAEKYNMGKILGVTDLPFRYEIQEPLLYSAECTYLQKSGGKERMILLNKYWVITSESDTIIYDFGAKWDTCLPAFSIKSNPEDVWETHFYDPYGNLLSIEKEEKKDTE